MPSRNPAPLAVALAAIALVGVGGEARASLTARCSWPPPGGPAVRPDAVQAEVAPLVGDLDGDGNPEIVFLSFSNGLADNMGRDGVLRILRGSDCSEIASVEDVGCVTCFGDAACRSLDVSGDPAIFCPACTPAIVDLDRDGLMEIIVLTETGDISGRGRRLVILDHRGQFVRCSEPTAEFIGQLAALAVADLEADGEAEIVARDVLWRETGELRWDHPISGIGASIIADLDGDGLLDVTTGQIAHRPDGTHLWANPDLRGASPAIADLDLDCRPELVVTSRNNESINVVDPVTGAIRASAPIPPGDCPPRPDGQGGPPTLGDVDGDCVPEIGVAGCRRYALYRYHAGPPEMLELAWEAPIDDESSRTTGSAIFDLEGDGTAEILYNDHHRLHVFDAVTGALETSLANTTNTLLELPVVADADGDGRAEILMTANDYARCCDVGLRVLVDDTIPWAPVRALYNQHSYHVTNILDDGSLPLPEEASWTRYNTYRVQGEPLREDTAGPRLIDVPPDAAIACGPVPAPVPPEAEGGCADVPVVTLVEERIDGPCPQAFDLLRTWTATDRCGRTAEATQVVSVTDLLAPVLGAIPPDATFTCAAPPAPAVGASDACDPAPVVEMIEIDEPGPCPFEHRLTRTWNARDACGNTDTGVQVVDVVDDGPPELIGVPADVVATCTAPPAPIVTALDGCDPDPVVTFVEVTTPGPCPSEFRVTRTWEARDACDRLASATQIVDVVDDGPPRLVGVPGDSVADCASVPGPPTVTAEDGCDGAPVVAFEEERLDGPCPSEYTLVRTWEATDSCGHRVSATARVEVTDTTPPRVTSVPETACLWPPNHWMVCFEPGSFRPEIEDDCPGEVSWRFVGCASDQPENDLGDGDTAPDCVIRDDGTACVRAERQGTVPAGRHYGLAIVAVDACGNTSLPTIIADVYVPHDQSPHEDCLKTTVVGVNDRGR